MIKNSYMKGLFLILTIASTTCFAQSKDDAVKAPINKLFDGMRRSDTAFIRSAFTGNPVLQTIVKTRAGELKVVTEALDSFLVSIVRPHTQVYDERITFDMIKTDGELAMAWTPYRFYVGETFSHCGVDSFQLVKINGEWKIQYLIDTRRKENCD